MVPPAGDARAPWNLTHYSYHHFHDLLDDLGPPANCMDNAPFPRKHVFACRGAKLEERRAGLEVWLQELLRQNEASFTPWSQKLVDFFEATREPKLPREVSAVSSSSSGGVGGKALLNGRRRSYV